MASSFAGIHDQMIKDSSFRSRNKKADKYKEVMAHFAPGTTSHNEEKYKEAEEKWLAEMYREDD